MNWFICHRSRIARLLLVFCFAAPCYAQNSAQAKPEASLKLAEVGSAPISFRSASNLPEITVPLGKSAIADALIPVSKVSVATTAIADVFVLSPTQLLITGKGIGTTSLFVWDKNGKMQSYDIVVQPEIAQLNARLKEAFPGEEIKVTALKDALILSGPPADEYTAKKAMELAQPVSKNLINLLEPPPVKDRRRILLQVKIAEVDRSTARELGINLFNMGQAKMVSQSTTGQFPSVGSAATVTGRIPRTPLPYDTSTTLSDSLNLFAFRPDINLGATIRALENRSLLQILAEPNLLAYNGKEATFLAGGEFPIPIVQGVGQGASVGIQFREFGVRLSFTPTLMPNGAIHMKVRPEVSTLDFANGGNLNGFRIPALNTRRVETEIELNEGESFGIAGLIDNRVIETYSHIPLMSSIPVIGALFKSKIKSKNNSELLVVVTPKVVQPFRPEQPPVLPEMDTPYLREPKLEGKMGYLSPPPPKSSEPKLDGKSGYQDPTKPNQSQSVQPAVPLTAPAGSPASAPTTPPGAGVKPNESSKASIPSPDVSHTRSAVDPPAAALGSAAAREATVKDPP